MHGLLVLSLSLGIPYCFMLFHPSLVARVLKKINREEATGILVVPKWTTQAWFPVLLSMLISHPREIRPHKQLLTLPLVPDSFRPLHKKLVLLAVHLSGTCCKVLAYQHRLQSLSATHGDQVLEYNTIRSCEGREGFVLGDRYIPLLPL